MLIGQYSSKLTNNDRIAVPKKFRDELGEELIIAKWYESCLVMVSKNGWERLQERLVGPQGFIVTTVRDIDRFILGSAFEVRLDNQGRCVIPEVLLAFANIKDDVVFLGLSDRVEIWARDTWLEIEKSAEKKAAEAIEKQAKNI